MYLEICSAKKGHDIFKSTKSIWSFILPVTLKEMMLQMKNILLLLTTSLCLLGLQVDGWKEDLVRGSLEQHFLYWNFYLPFACSECFKIHLSMQIPLKMLEICSFIYRKLLISNTFSHFPYVCKCLLSCNITVLLQIKTEMATPVSHCRRLSFQYISLIRRMKFLQWL